jgi:uncharacterized protein
MELIKNHFSALVIAVAVVLTGWFLGKSFSSKGKPDPIVSVTGLGEQSFDSDLIVWRANFSRRNFELKSAYNELNRDVNAVKRYLKSRGIADSEVVFEAADIQKDYSYYYDDQGRLSNSVFNGYVLTQNMKVQSKNVDLVEKTSREVSQLIDAGIELNSFSPEYYYTKLTELKLKMIEQATKDAYERAQKIAENGGGKINKLMQADMGVFQIIAENSSEEYNWGGSFNTTSRRKTANITMRLKYLVD